MQNRGCSGGEATNDKDIYTKGVAHSARNTFLINWNEMRGADGRKWALEAQLFAANPFGGRRITLAGECHIRK
jgi:hypothetical protein